jgi:hypothetical protein
LYIFDREGVCLYYREWKRTFSTFADQPDEDRKLVFSTIFAVTNWMANIGAREPPEGFQRIDTDAYSMHHFATPTGLHFALNTNPKCPDMHAALRQIYADLYVECALRNPLYVKGTPITCAPFVSGVDALVTALPQFR